MMTESLNHKPEIEALQHESQLVDNFDTTEVEAVARNGFDTYRGVRELEFRVGIEIEFHIGQPATYRDIMANPETHESRKLQLTSTILNPETIDAKDQDNTELIDEFRGYATAFVSRLVPKDEVEEATQSKWLSQVNEFDTPELLNFMLYEEFSKPQLGITSVPDGATLEGVDEFAEQSGWLEWRFGTGSLQSGYYDNAGMSEIRLSPCSPSEALRRSVIIKEKMKELGDQFGVMVVTSANMEHINVSAYDTARPEHRSIIGNDAETSVDTVDAVSGIMKAHQDGINLKPSAIKNYDYMFSKYSSDALSVGPTRKTLRVLDGRLELRGGFSSTANGIAWVTAGVVEGLSVGADGLHEAGFATAKHDEVFEVQRTPAFDKKRDLQIQRAFENSERDADGVFKLSSGYEMIRNKEIEASFFGDMKHDGINADIVIAAAELDDAGTPFITAARLHDAYAAASDSYKRIGDINEDQIDPFVATLNERLATIRISKGMAVTGRSERVGVDRTETIARLSGSRVVALALASNVGGFVNEINQAADEYESKNKT